MDRVLIVIDNVQFSGHLANTLRKVGYDTESLQNEFNLSDRILSFNPDIIIVRGSSSRLSAMNVGKKIKEYNRFNGKVILIFGADQEPSIDELSDVKSDLNLVEPASVLRIATSVLNLEATNKKSLEEKLYKLASEDPTFRSEEQGYLVKYGTTIEQEVIRVKALNNLNDSDLTHIKSKIKQELKQAAAKDRAKIESYNQQIDKINVDLKQGLSKRQTKQENKNNRKDWQINDDGQPSDLDNLRKEFTNELFKKKSN